MAARPLVDSDIDLGARLLDALDKEGIPIEVAYWFLSDLWGAWWLVLGTSQLTARDSFPLRLRINEILRTLEDHEFAMDKLGIVGMDHYWVRAIFEVLPRGLPKPGYRLGEFSARDARLWAEDSYVYRMPTKRKARAHGATPKRRTSSNGMPPSQDTRTEAEGEPTPGAVPG